MSITVSPAFIFLVGQYVRFASVSIGDELTGRIRVRTYNEDDTGGSWNSYRVRVHGPANGRHFLEEIWLSENELEAVASGDV